MNKYSITAIILLLIFETSCSESLDKCIPRMISQTAVIDSCQMLKVPGRRNLYPQNIRYRVIVYFDADECMSCAAGKLHQWNKLILANTNKGVAFDYIFSPHKDEIGNLRISILASRFNRDVYIDTAGIFEKHNSWIPKLRECHTLLVDSDNKVVMVGDPRRNKSLMNLFNDIVEGNQNNNDN